MKVKPTIDEALDLLMSKLDESVSTNTVIDSGQWYLYFTFDVIGRVTFSKPFGLPQQGRDIGNTIAIGGYLERHLGFVSSLP